MTCITKISFVPRDSGEKSVSFDMVNYGFGGNSYVVRDNILGKFKSLGFRIIDNNGYTDYVTVLTIEEFKEFHKLNYIETSIRLDDLKKIRYNWVVIEIYEWESGLD